MSCIDLHCHLMPYVDDGAVDLDEAIDLMFLQVRQGVSQLCLTPHLRRGMFTSSDEAVRAGYARLVRVLKEENLPLQLHLGREYYYDDDFCSRLQDKTVIPLGNHNGLLVEFSHSASAVVLQGAVEQIREAGYVPLLAHVERYPTIREKRELLPELVRSGAKIQINAASLLGLEGWRTKHFVWKLLKSGLVDAVASDAHDTQVRKPNLGLCRTVLEKKLGRAAAEALLYTNPLAILHAPVEE